MNGAVVRILLRYVVGGLFMGSVAIGDRLAADPDLVAAGAVALGAAVEGAYALAKRRGWGALMISALFSRLWGYLVATGAILAGLAMWGASKKREGRKEVHIETLKDSVKRQEDGRDAVSDLRGAGRDELIDRLRKNDGQW